MRHASRATAAPPGRRSTAPRTFLSCGSPKKRGRWPSAETRRGFTLVELLVVISIIAVLASLILPGVMNARRSARRAQCLNNMKQLGIAFVDYYTTHNVFPASGRIDLDPPRTRGVDAAILDQLTFAAEHLAYEKRDYTAIEQNPTEPHPGGMRYSWAREMLPRLERTDLHESWDDTEDQGYGTYLDTNVVGSGKIPPMAVDGPPGLSQNEIRSLVCPEDASAQPGKGNLSYVVNGGFTPHITLWPSCASLGDRPEEARWIADNNFKMGLMFLEGYYYVGDDRNKYGRRHSGATVRDGLTMTIMATENVNAGFNVDVNYGDSQRLVQEVNWACPHPFNTSFFVQTPMTTPLPHYGLVIVWQEPETAYKYTASNPRNASGGINGDLTLLNESKAPYPSSFHPGGVHIMMCDGTVRFLTDSVSGEIYARLVTPDGAHVAGPNEGPQPTLQFETYGGNAQIPLNEKDIP